MAPVSIGAAPGASMRASNRRGFVRHALSATFAFVSRRRGFSACGEWRLRMRDPLAGRTAVVTGASSGIGRALTLRLAARGMRVVAAARSADALRELAREAGAPVHVVQIDVTREDSVAELRETARRACPRVDVVVNNAGVGYVEPFASSPVAHWHETLATNLIGALSVTRAFLPLLLERGGGLVVNIGSASAAGWPHVALYAASKAALHAASIAIDRELRGSGVRVLSVDIGPTAGTASGRVPIRRTSRPPSDRGRSWGSRRPRTSRPPTDRRRRSSTWSRRHSARHPCAGVTRRRRRRSSPRPGLPPPRDRRRLAPSASRSTSRALPGRTTIKRRSKYHKDSTEMRRYGVLPAASAA